MAQELVDRLVSQIEKVIHGQGRGSILKQLEQSPTADTLATIVYQMIVNLEARAAARGGPLDIDVLMGVATDTIDMLIEIAAAMGIEIAPDETLIKVLLLHMKEVEDDPEEKAAAAELLEQMTADGSMEMSMAYVNERADASLEQMQAMGAQMIGPQQKPLVAGIKQGLMQ